ncbi:hypothetical protein PSEEN3996 [Pseudomonas entomophila L48]|uniref:Uncharacterized protein n=1 Tax=Pseudomonas entomophila (strain L48) TaxID=384676 RepID=Q1I6N9_PSEE4|nr:hypothetical protein PSEEN3996 [Pseudomonas entomophila L48]
MWDASYFVLGSVLLIILYGYLFGVI